MYSGNVTNESRNRQLHPRLSHVLRLDRLYRKSLSRHRSYIRAPPRSTILVLPQPRRMAQREAPAAAHPEALYPTDAGKRTIKVHTWMRMG
jgi:hypothetical protein